MMSKIPCEMIRDLFPSYIDKLTGDKTNELIEEHLAGCEECSAVLAAMHAPDTETTVVPEGTKKEIDFLKKLKTRSVKIAIGSVATTALLIGAVLFIRAFVVGDYLYGDWIACNVQVSGTDLVMDGTALDSVHGIAKVTFEEKDGVVTARTKAVLAGFLHDGSFHAEFTAQNKIRQIRINDRILWDEGEEISSLTSEVYQTRHEYMGDMVANNRTANALGLSQYLGSYGNELKTSERPYAWKIRLVDDMAEDDVSASDTTVGIRTIRENDMEMFGYIMLAVVDNLDEVVYEYTVNGEEITKTVTAEDATAFFGQDIKDCGASVRLLNALIRKTGLDTYAVGRTASSEDKNSIMVHVINFTENEIDSIGVSFYNNGVCRESFGTSNAGGEPIKKGDRFSFGYSVDDFDAANFEDDLTGHELTMEITLETLDGADYPIDQKLRVPSLYGTEITLKLYGSAKDGFRIVQ